MTERGGTQHSARVDDELERETEPLVRGTREAHAQEWRMKEPPADGEPLPDAVPASDDFELRSLIAISVRPSAFPGNRDALVAVAESEFAHDDIIERLRGLPADVTFPNVEAVWEALGGRGEQRIWTQSTTSEPGSARATKAESTREPAPDSPPAPSLAARACGSGRAVVMFGIGMGVGIAAGVVRRIRRML
ncbi:MAG TPA: DUF2795 domain-containing protein [Acidimicrobiia bacterium]|nr:DUF2795 domain-containing protein [Acidimicrobiia bacterium]